MTVLFSVIYVNGLKREIARIETNTNATSAKLDDIQIDTTTATTVSQLQMTITEYVNEVQEAIHSINTISTQTTETSSLASAVQQQVLGISITGDGPIRVSGFSIDCPTCVTSTSGGAITSDAGDIIFTGETLNRLLGDSTLNVDLSETGVNDGIYGDAKTVPVFNVDSKGRILGVTNTVISGLTANNLSDTAGITNTQLLNDGVTITAGNGLTGGGGFELGSGGSISIDAPACASNERLSWNGTNFICSTVAAGTITNANTFYAGPTSGDPSTPTYREIVAADLGSGTASNKTVLLGNKSWLQIFDINGKLNSSLLPDSILGSLKYKGTWNAITNTPTLGNNGAGGVLGDYYIVSAGGEDVTEIDGEETWEVGDWIVNNGTYWNEIENDTKVSSVNGLQGAVVLTTDDINEGSTNKYFTDLRAREAISGTSPIVYNSTTGEISCPTCVVTGVGGDIIADTGLSITGTLTDRLLGSGDVTFGLSTSVPTSVTDDTNVKRSISSNTLTLSWSGQLSATKGGTGVNGGSASNGQLLIGNGSGYSLATITGTSNQITVTNGSGTITLSLPQGIATTSNPTFNSITLGAGGSSVGKLYLKNDTNAYSTILQSGTPTSANITFTLPSSDGTSGQVLSTNGSGVLGWSDSGACTTCFTQNGNSFGGLATLGTNDNYGIAFEINNGEVMRLIANGNLVLGATSTATGASNTLTLANSTAPSGSPSGSGVIYSEGGVIKVKNTSGETTAVAPLPIGEMYMTGNTSVSNVTVAGTLIKAAGTTTLSSGARNFDMPASNRLRYTGTHIKMFTISVTSSLKTTAGNTQAVEIQIYKNGVAVAPSQAKITVTSNLLPLPTQALISLAQNDYVEIWVTNNSSANNDVIIDSLNVRAVGFSAGTD